MHCLFPIKETQIWKEVLEADVIIKSEQVSSVDSVLVLGCNLLFLPVCPFFSFQH